MRKENSKYVERDGPIRDNDKCNMTCAEYAEGGAPLSFYFDGQVCECVDPTSGDPVFKSQGSGYANLGACCNKHPGAEGCDQCPSGGGGALCPPDQNYPTVSSPFGPFMCCQGERAQACSGDDNGDSLCAAYELAQSLNQCQYVEFLVNGKMKTIKVCPEDVPSGFQNLPSCTGAPSPPPSPPSIRNRCKSDSDCDTGYRCHRNRCKKRHGGHKRKKEQPSPSPSPSPGPSPVTGKGSNKGGMSGGEIAGIVVGSVAGAILLLLAVGALLRGSGKKGKKK